MLRITTHRKAREVLVILEGRLAGEWVDELRKVLTDLWLDPDPARVAIQLTGVSGIDAAGRGLLCEAFASGADLQGSGLAARTFIEEIAGATAGTGHRGNTTDLETLH